MAPTRIGKARTATVAVTGPLARAHDALTLAGWRWRWHGWPLYLAAGAWALAGAAHLAHLRLVLTASLIAVALCIAGAVFFAEAHPRYFHYTTAVVVWTVFASFVGPWRPAAGWLALVTLLPCAVNWWLHLRIRPAEVDVVPPLALEWDAYVTPKTLPGSWLTDVVTEPGITTAIIRLSREAGLNAADVKKLIKQITANLGRAEGTLVIDEIDSTPNAALLTLFDRNPLEDSPPWPGPTFDPKTGHRDIGLFTDGSQMGEEVLSSSGTADCIVVGLKGTGKSGYNHVSLREAYDSGVAVPIFLDPQNGQSAPEWVGRVPTALGITNCVLALEQLAAHVLARSEHLASVEYVDAKGTARRGFDAYRLADRHIHRLPILWVVVDELPRLLKDPTLKRRAVAALDTIAALDRKTGVRITGTAQSPLLSEFGAATALRENLDSGTAVMFRLGEISASAAVGGTISRDAARIPKFLPGRVETKGFCFTNGLDGRSSMGRTWNPATVPGPAERGPVNGAPELDPLTAAVVAAINHLGESTPVQDPVPDGVQTTIPEATRPTEGAREAILWVASEYADRGEPVTTAQLKEELRRRWSYSPSMVSTTISMLRSDNLTDPSTGLAKVAHGVYTLPTQRSDS